MEFASFPLALCHSALKLLCFGRGKFFFLLIEFSLPPTGAFFLFPGPLVGASIRPFVLMSRRRALFFAFVPCALPAPLGDPPFFSVPLVFSSSFPP